MKIGLVALVDVSFLQRTPQPIALLKWPAAAIWTNICCTDATLMYEASGRCIKAQRYEAVLSSKVTLLEVLCDRKHRRRGTHKYRRPFQCNALAHELCIYKPIRKTVDYKHMRFFIDLWVA